MMLWIWLGITIIAAVIELITIDLVSIWFTIGGIGALIAYALGLSQTIQIVVFVILSIICIFASRPLAKKYLKTQTVSTNYDRVIGQHGLVLKRIDRMLDKFDSFKIENNSMSDNRKIINNFMQMTPEEKQDALNKYVGL